LTKRNAEIPAAPPPPSPRETIGGGTMELFNKVQRNRSFLEKLIARGLKESDLEAIIRKKRADEVYVKIPCAVVQLTPEQFEQMLKVQRPGPRRRKKRDPRHDAIAGLVALSRNKLVDPGLKKLLGEEADRLKGDLTPEKRWIRKPWRKIHKEIIYDLVVFLEPLREAVNQGFGVFRDFKQVDTISLISEMLGLPFEKVNNDFHNYFRNSRHL